ncbi:MAG: hypothetical protein R6U17_08240 [Thermoplasmata archaeon]
MDKRIHKKVNKDDDSVTLTDIQEMIEEIQKAHPDREVFFDGDDFAICSRKKRDR